MQFNNILDKIFSQPTGVKILRFLVLYKPEMTGREIARFSGVSHMQVYRVMDEFESQGMVTRTQLGKSNLFKLNEDNIIIKMLLKYIFEKEKTLLKDILKDALNEVEDKILSTVVFGSVSKEKERPGSDVDIFILTKDSSSSRIIKINLPDIEIEFFKQTGNRLSPIVLTLQELQSKLKTNRTLISKILEGKVIIGKQIKGIINGWKNTKKNKR